jgi:hypothetical protein
MQALLSGDRGILMSRRLIVTVQVAVVVLLQVGSGLLLRSFWRLQHVDLGFTAGEVVTMEMRLLNPKYREEDGSPRFTRICCRGFAPCRELSGRA